MSKSLRAPVLFACGALAVIVTGPAAEACWCSGVYTRSYYDPCVSCPSVSRSYACPIPVCPTTSCSTTNVERCYYEPRTTYETRSVLQRELSYVRRSYYDPLTCCYRSYLAPTTQYVERSYQVPIIRYVKQCSTEPETSCTTSYAPATGSSYYMPETIVRSYWTPDGYVYCPTVTTVPSVIDRSCPATNGNGSKERRSEYGPAGDSASGTNKAPDPKPMPSKLEDNKSGARRVAPPPGHVSVLVSSQAPTYASAPPPNVWLPVRGSR